MKILLMGPQACGKGTQGEKLSAYLKIPVISSGQTLRDIPPNHPRFKEINDIMEKGELVPQSFVAELIRARISMDDCKNGFILDGWFRTMEDVRQFDVEPDLVIVINISLEESIRRISGRRYCPANGKFYNILTLPKEELAKCPGELVQREDDKEEVVKRRMEIYNTNTKEVLEFLRNRGTKILQVEGNGVPDEVFARILKELSV